MHAYIYTNIHTYIHKCIHTHIQVHTRIHTYTTIYIHTYRQSGRPHTEIIHTYTHTYIGSSMQAGILPMPPGNPADPNRFARASLCSISMARLHCVAYHTLIHVRACAIPVSKGTVVADVVGGYIPVW